MQVRTRGDDRWGEKVRVRARERERQKDRERKINAHTKIHSVRTFMLGVRM